MQGPDTISYNTAAPCASRGRGDTADDVGRNVAFNGILFPRFDLGGLLAMPEFSSISTWLIAQAVHWQSLVLTLG